MSQSKNTIGVAIDQVLSALEPFDEKARKTILGTVCSYLGVRLDDTVAPSSPWQLEHPPAVIAPQPGPASHRAVDIRLLKDEKQPKNAIQMACLVAYYLSELVPEGERRDTIRVEDLDKYFKQAKFKLPAKLSQLLIDSKAAGYFDSAGRGEYRLNSVGYNLVAHSMPQAK